MNSSFYINCPHCNLLMQVNKSDINCTIFRHGAYKNSLHPINPHSSKEECERLIKSNLVYGCCKPFIFNGREVIKTNEYR